MSWWLVSSMRRIRYPEIDIVGDLTAYPSSLRRETMHHLDDECPVERAGQRPGVREPKPGERLSGVSGVPHHEHIIPNHGYPVEADIEVDALALIVVLDECEQARAHIEIVLQAARRQHSRERADRQVSSCPGQIGAHDDMATAAPRRRKLEIGAVTTVKRAPVHERSEAQGAARVHEILELITRSEEHTSELQSRLHLVCRLLLEKKKKKKTNEDVRYTRET